MFGSKKKRWKRLLKLYFGAQFKFEAKYNLPVFILYWGSQPSLSSLELLLIELHYPFISTTGCNFSIGYLISILSNTSKK